MADIDDVGAERSVDNDSEIDAAKASPRAGAAQDATPALPHASYNVLRGEPDARKVLLDLDDDERLLDARLKQLERDRLRLTEAVVLGRESRDSLTRVTRDLLEARESERNIHALRERATQLRYVQEHRASEARWRDTMEDQRQRYEVLIADKLPLLEQHVRAAGAVMAECLPFLDYVAVRRQLPRADQDAFTGVGGEATFLTQVAQLLRTHGLLRDRPVHLTERVDSLVPWTRTVSDKILTLALHARPFTDEDDAFAEEADDEVVDRATSDED